ncbi:MAG: oxygen-independent coproporphyrinogen III oxidase [Pseudorhodobacter sp.]
MDTQTRLRKHGLFNARAPRYTSYPTAPHFGSLVGPGTFAGWISVIPDGAEISLYLHIPFCRRLCWFCACRTQGTTSNAPIRAYIDTILQEITLLRANLPPGVRLRRLHWGGGTPTLLSPAQMRQIAAALFEMAPLADGAEFSVEIDPNEIDEPRLSALEAIGMNRASIGVQDFDPLIQKAIGREQGFELTRDVVAMVRQQGVASLNADILYGLPYQNKKRITDSVNKLIALRPDRVALYGYAHVPWMSRRQQLIPADALPEPPERLMLFETAQELFIKAGYEAIGIDHFALPQDNLARAAREGRLRRNFQGYTDDAAPVLIGLGASAISRFPQGYAQNRSSTADYTTAIRAGTFATVRGHAFSSEDLIRARIIEALMCDFRISRQELATRFDLPPGRIELLLTEAQRQFGSTIRLDQQALSIPTEAKPLTRMVAQVFDAYAKAGGQHSTAV